MISQAPPAMGATALQVAWVLATVGTVPFSTHPVSARKAATCSAALNPQCPPVGV